MSEHGYTSHGHSLPGKTQHPEHRPEIINCGGPIICKQCRMEVKEAFKQMFQPDPEQPQTEQTEDNAKTTPLNQILGKYVTDSRRRNFLSQQALADRMNNQFGYNWHQTVISKIENGEREITAKELFHLATIFGHREIADPIVDIIGKFGANNDR